MQSLQAQLIDMGFTPDQVLEATRRSGGNRDAALAYLMGDSDVVADPAAAAAAPPGPPPPLRELSPEPAVHAQAVSPAPSSAGSILAVPAWRRPGAPGQLVSAHNPEVGAVLTALLIVPQLARAVLGAAVEAGAERSLAYDPRWWRGDSVAGAGLVDPSEDEDGDAPPPPAAETAELLELGRLAAFVNATVGPKSGSEHAEASSKDRESPFEARARASVRSFEVLLPKAAFAAINEFAQYLATLPGLRPILVTSITPLRSSHDSGTADSLAKPLDITAINLDASDEDSFDGATDAYFWPSGLSDPDDSAGGFALDETLPDIISLEVNSALPIVDEWFPQRYQRSFGDVLAAYRTKHREHQQELTRLRQRRLGLRSFRGNDVVKMLRAAQTILDDEATLTAEAGGPSESESPATAKVHTSEDAGQEDALALQDSGALSRAAMNVGGILEQVESAMTATFDDIEVRQKQIRELPEALRKMDPTLLSELGFASRRPEPYKLTALVFGDSNFYVRFHGRWWNLGDDGPVSCDFEDVRDASIATPGYLAVYSRQDPADRQVADIPAPYLEFLARDAEQLEEDLDAYSNSDRSLLSDSGEDDEQKSPASSTRQHERKLVYLSDSDSNEGMDVDALVPSA